MRNSTYILFFLISFFLNNCTQKGKVAKSKNVYYSIPENYDLHRQSPVNIVTRNVENIIMSEPEIISNYKNDSAEELVNKGTTVEIEFHEGNGLHYHNKEYDFDQLHFHTPAEHLFDGITYPMEMHMVHHLSKNKMYHLVIACIFKEGAENKFIKDFLNLVPEDVGEEVAVLNIEVDPFIENLQSNGFYSYDGSLTTKPYTETVTWIVLKQIFEASPEQIQAVNKIEGNNARHITPLYNRKIQFHKVK